MKNLTKQQKQELAMERWLRKVKQNENYSIELASAIDIIHSEKEIPGANKERLEEAVKKLMAIKYRLDIQTERIKAIEIPNLEKAMERLKNIVTEKASANEPAKETAQTTD
jgi:hypothetical protein